MEFRVPFVYMNKEAAFIKYLVDEQLELVKFG